MVCSKADKIQTIGRHKVRQGKAKHPWCNSESPRVSCPYSASDRAPNHHASGRERATAPPLQAQAQAQERGLDWTAAVVVTFPPRPPSPRLLLWLLLQSVFPSPRLRLQAITHFAKSSSPFSQSRLAFFLSLLFLELAYKLNPPLRIARTVHPPALPPDEPIARLSN